jgi:hypothetical protein
LPSPPHPAGIVDYRLAGDDRLHQLLRAVADRPADDVAQPLLDRKLEGAALVPLEEPIDSYGVYQIGEV